jgi:streptogramin lyase
VGLLGDGTDQPRRTAAGNRWPRGGASFPSGVAVDAGHVYWANAGGGAIGRANLDGTGANQSFIGGASFPFGVAVGAG